MDSLRNELGQVESALEAGKSSERDALDSLDSAEQRTALLEQLIRTQTLEIQTAQDSIALLERELGPREQHLAQLGVGLLNLEDDRTRLEQSLARSLLAERRLSSWASLEFLLGSHSWQEIMARRVVIGRLQRTERQSLTALSAAVDTLQIAESDIFEATRVLRERKQALDYQQRQAAEFQIRLQADHAALASEKLQTKARLRRIRKDQKALSARERELSAAQSAIQDLIARGARGEPVTGMPLAMQKGRLPWPCAGEVAARFGLVKNRELDTRTENPGIDISADSGAEVRAVGDGQVTSVSWLRGYGNVCIVEHPGAFFTVYARLGQIVVHAHDTIQAGSILGYTGFDPESDSHRVHFELWSGKEKQNPLAWLIPR